MKLAELKAAVYQLAQVSTTKQLKAQNKAIKPLDLRYKISWEKALAELRSAKSTSKTKQPDARVSEGKKKESALKKKTKAQHKRTNAKQATEENAPDRTSPRSFKDWLDNPPHEFSELFAAADTALASLDKKLEKGKQMTQQAIAMTSSLDEFAEATVEEAKRLAKAAQQAIDVAKEADLN